MQMWMSRYAVSAILSSVPITTSFSAVARTRGLYHPITLTHFHSPLKLMSSSSSSPIIPQDEHVVASNLQHVKQRIEEALQKHPRPSNHPPVRLVAVSKTKPIEMLLEAYHIGGQRYFGENYVQELITKVPLMPKDVQWHFIGPLQSNKAALLVKSVGLEQLACVESVDSIKLASKLNRAVEGLFHENKEEEGVHKKLKIFIQVNTSLEDTKSGVEDIQEVVQLALDIQKTCPYLQIQGLMTIGSPGDFTCFDSLVSCRTQVAQALSLSDETQLELSMGMSNDFEEAIGRGSTNVRVGSTIFGERIYPSKKMEVEADSKP